MNNNSRLAFAVEFEGEYHFRVLEYQLSLSIMKLQVSRGGADTKKEGVILLENIQYFAGWFSGTGQIRNGDNLDCIQILRRSSRYNSIPDEYLLQQFALFEIMSVEEPVMKVVLQNAKFFL